MVQNLIIFILLLFPFRKIPGCDLDSPCRCVLSGHHGYQGFDLGTVYDNSNLQPAQSNARLPCSVCWGKYMYRYTYLFMVSNVIFSFLCEEGKFCRISLINKSYLVLLSPYFLDANHKKSFLYIFKWKKNCNKFTCFQQNN